MNKSAITNLYIKEQKSVREIATILGCSENKINYWLKKYEIKKRSISEALYKKHNPNGDPFLFKKPITTDKYFLLGLGLGLYWGEGNKRNKNSVRLGNTDPDLIKVFLIFLIDIYSIDQNKLRFGLQIFNDMDAGTALDFWVKKLKVSKAQFGKVIVTPSRSIGTYKEKTKYGVLTIYFSNTKLRNLLCKQIEDLRSLR